MSIRIFQKGFNFSQDGPGNRLVYHLQGCNLRCPWCANPEGLEHCGGEMYTMNELVDEVSRSRMLFFDGGGVTLTGGEVTMQFDAVKELLSTLHEQGIHTCIETNGVFKRLPELFPVLDMLIMDIKHYDERIHEKITGVPNTITIQNIKEACDVNQKLALRIPLIGGINASEKDAYGFVELFSKLDFGSDVTIELLTYHEYGKDKYASLGMEYTMTEKAYVSKEQRNQFSKILQDAGFHLIKT